MALASGQTIKTDKISYRFFCFIGFYKYVCSMKHKYTLDYVKGDFNVYFSADLHLGHRNIVRGVSTWPTNTRNFQTLEEHDAQIIANINSRVKENDHLFLLGDFSFKGFGEGDFDKLFEYRSQINCKNIHFIYGNHDDVIIHNPELEEMFTSVSFYTELKIILRELNEKNKKYNFVLSHYSFRTWNGMYQGAMMLYGHSHNMLPEFINDQGLALKTIDVGIDTRHDMSPYSLDEVLEIMESKDLPMLDDRLTEYANKR